MKKLGLSIIACLALGTFAVAGGDIVPVIEPVEEVAPAPVNSGPYIGGGISFLTWNETLDLREPDLQMEPI